MTNKDFNHEHELSRRKFWQKAWVSVAGVFNSRYPESATRWADQALKEYDERFKSITEKNNK